VNDLTITRPIGIVEKMSQRFGILEPEKFYGTLKRTAFKGNTEPTNEQMMMLLIVSDQHRLNPFTKEIYAYPDKRGGIVPVVGLDGWLRIMNEHKQFDGISSTWDREEKAMTCTIWRKDRAHPIVITEYLDECKRSTDAWRDMPRRMMRNRAEIQCIRVAFGFAGIAADDAEAQVIANSDDGFSMGPKPYARGSVQRVRDALREEPADALPVAEVIETEPGDLDDDGTRLAIYMDKLARIVDEADAEALLDYARDDLPTHAYNELATAYRARHDTEEKSEP